MEIPATHCNEPATIPRGTVQSRQGKPRNEARVFSGLYFQKNMLAYSVLALKYFAEIDTCRGRDCQLDPKFFSLWRIHQKVPQNRPMDLHE